MTENEAIKELTNENIQIAIGNLAAIKLICKKFENAEETIDMAIQALEEIQQYRAIGTVAEIKWIIQRNLAEHDRLSAFDRIGTVEEFKALKEKSVAKKPFFNGANYECPNCNTRPYEDYAEDKKPMYCNICGQKLEWE